MDDKIKNELKKMSSTFLFCCLVCCAKWLLILGVDEIPDCKHSGKSFQEVPFRGAVCHAFEKHFPVMLLVCWAEWL